MLTTILTTLTKIIGNQNGNFMGTGGNEGSPGKDSGVNGDKGVGTPSEDTTGSGGTQESKGNNTPSKQAIKVNYPSGLDETLVGHPAFNSFTDAEGNINYANIMKSYVHQQKLIGGEKMLVPTKNFSEDQWKETFTKLGLPKELDKYDIKNNVPEGMSPNENIFKGFKKAAHEAGILPQQAQKVVDYYNTAIANELKNQNGLSKQKFEADKLALQKEWGGNYEVKLGAAMAGLDHFADANEKKYLMENGYLDDINITKLFAKIGESLQAEDSTFNDNTKSDFGAGIDDVNNEMKELYSQISKIGKGNPDREVKMQRYQSLLNKKIKLQGQDPNQIISAR